MNSELLAELCRRAGVAADWQDYLGETHQVAAEDLREVLALLGLGADDDEDIRARLHELDEETREIPPLLTAEAGGELALPVPEGSWRLVLEDGSEQRGELEGSRDGRSRLRVPDVPGYHLLEVAGRTVTVAVAPARSFTPADAFRAARQGDRGWGLAVQLYSLRRAGDGGIGDFPALAAFAREAAAAGASVLAISPVHAQFSADPDRFGPYAPSSRIMLNVLHGGVDDLSGAPSDDSLALERAPLVDWPAAGRERLRRLRQAFDAGEAETDTAFADWRREQGDPLERHAVFEALHQHLWKDRGGSWHWKHWPEAFRDPEGDAVRAFAREHALDVTFHAWMQYRADRQLAAAQAAAVEGGMSIGLISDLAVGTDAGGSHGWSRQGETLVGLTVGAPPDLLQKNGQNWGITAFSARGLRRHGFRAFIEMLRAAMRHAGGVRIDHAMGLARLWIVPEGRSAAHGTYLSLPQDDLLRLVRLESVRNRAIVLGEDLGTLPEGFQERLEKAGVDGMRVLWFERTEHGYRPPRDWSRGASAMTSTHDLPTVAGWWSGWDVRYRRHLGDSEHDEQQGLAQRARDRTELWEALVAAGSAMGDEPPSWDGWPAVDAAVNHVGGSNCELAVIPMEDILALEEQPNIPGTTDEHPNWRRRMPAEVGALLSGDRTALRLTRLDRMRRP
ncbi:4-alpha-glucanotransferase [Rhizosaccharibacter radicis]|uniref:4-alpha-glucanotransferase n=1 Tax=Rhizosaccharibacter radicis TaxID=2782605 RepID=A0ABT1VWB1_9PROT|nr:4-alpha-glucanotransferase [Acetobacteraceae bacterium KSS12]